MGLMKKIVMIFVGVTIISSLAFTSLGKMMVDAVSEGELDRGPGRTNAVISRIRSDINRAAEITSAISEYYGVKYNAKKNNYEKEFESIINYDIREKVEKAKVSNIILLESNFKTEKLLKTKDNLDKGTLESIIIKAKDIISRSKYTEKGFFSGVISEKSHPYIVATRKISFDGINKYILIIERIDSEYIESMRKEIGRDINIIHRDEVNEKEMEVVVYDNNKRIFFYERSDTFTDFYTEIDNIYNSDDKFFIRLRDDRAVRNNARKNTYLLVSAVILITILSNLIIYYLIKKNIISRIIKINKTINIVREGTNLDLELLDDCRKDEISELNNDLNSMLRTLKIYSENLEFISRQDALTKLKNRYSINEYILSLTTHKINFSLFFIDLDNFKVINDTLGHNVGDNLLVKVAESLLNVVNSEENLTVGRLGGDEFIVVRKGENNIDEIDRIARKVLSTLNKYYEFNSYVYEIKASMGISFYSEHSSRGSELLQFSDIAMYCSKRGGGNKYSIFNERMLDPLRIEKKLKKAIENKEFKMYLQPIYSMRYENIGGFEALIRWDDGNEIIAPDKFIPLSKRTGDIVAIDNFIFKEAVKTVRELLDKGKSNFYISVNTSKLFLKQENLISFIVEELKNNDVSSKYIKMEVAEDEIIDDFQYTISLLEELRHIGIEIYLDDFGVGYSSFSHIKKLPIDTIKIDRSILIDISTNKKSQEIVKTLIILAHNLDIDIICEGVEYKEQVELLKILNCDNIQGYYFGKPSPKKLFTDKESKEI